MALEIYFSQIVNQSLLRTCQDQVYEEVRYAWTTQKHRIQPTYPQTEILRKSYRFTGIEACICGANQGNLVAQQDCFQYCKPGLRGDGNRDRGFCFEIALSAPQLDEAVLWQIDKEIPYHILFLLEYEGKYQAWTAYKEASGSGANAFKVGTYYHTDWVEESALPLKLDGLNTDQVYENFVRQIAGQALPAGVGVTLKESVERDACRQELQKQIAALQVKVHREKQLNKQVQFNAELKKLRKELEAYDK